MSKVIPIDFKNKMKSVKLSELVKQYAGQVLYQITANADHRGVVNAIEDLADDVGRMRAYLHVTDLEDDYKDFLQDLKNGNHNQ